MDFAPSPLADSGICSYAGSYPYVVETKKSLVEFPSGHLAIGSEHRGLPTGVIRRDLHRDLSDSTDSRGDHQRRELYGSLRP